MLVFAKLNIMAKRFRDIGGPGWLLVLAVAALGAALSLIAGETISSLFSSAVFLVLVLVPGGVRRGG